MIDKPFYLQPSKITNYSAFKVNLQHILDENQKYPQNSRYIDMIIKNSELKEKILKLRGKIKFKHKNFDVDEIISAYELNKTKEIQNKREKKMLEDIDAKIFEKIKELYSIHDNDIISLENIKIVCGEKFNYVSSDHTKFKNKILGDSYQFIIEKFQPLNFIENRFLLLIEESFYCNIFSSKNVEKQKKIEKKFKNMVKINTKNLTCLHHVENSQNISKNDNELMYQTKENTSFPSNNVSNTDIIKIINIHNGKKDKNINIHFRDINFNDQYVYWCKIRQFVKYRYSRSKYNLDTYNDNALYAEIYFCLRSGLNLLACHISEIYTTFFNNTCPAFKSLLKNFLLGKSSPSAKNVLSKDTPTDDFRSLLLAIFAKKDFIVNEIILTNLEDFLWANMQNSYNPGALVERIMQDPEIPAINKIFGTLLLGDFVSASNIIIRTSISLHDAYYLLRIICLRSPSEEVQNNFLICLFHGINIVFTEFHERSTLVNDALSFVNSENSLQRLSKLLIQTKNYDLLIEKVIPKNILDQVIEILKTTKNHKGLLKISTLISPSLLKEALITEMLELAHQGDIESFLIEFEQDLVKFMDYLPIKELFDLIVFKHNPTYCSLKKTLYYRNESLNKDIIKIRSAVEAIMPLANTVSLENNNVTVAAFISKYEKFVNNFNY